MISALSSFQMSDFTDKKICNAPKFVRTKDGGDN